MHIKSILWAGWMVLWAAGSIQAGVFSNGTSLPDATIKIDGSMSDWTEAMVVATDGAGEPFYSYSDLNKIYMANDGINLYVRFTTVGNMITNTVGGRLFYLVIDGDSNSATGTNYVGPANFRLDGAEVQVQVFLGNDSADASVFIKKADGAGGWTDVTPAGGWHRTDSVTGTEFLIPLSTIGCSSDATFRWIAVSDSQGDTIPGLGWNQYVGYNTYTCTLGAPARMYSNSTPLDQTSITLDGLMTDWSESMVVATDGDETGIFPSYVDLKKVYMANDASNLYIRDTTQGNAVTNVTNGGFLILIDADNNANTGTNYAGGGNFAMNGVEVMAQVYVANDSEDANVFVRKSDGAGGWTDATPTRMWHRTDSVTGTELCIPLATLGITQNTVMRWGSVESAWGDTLPGLTWNQAFSSSTYAAILPPSDAWWSVISRGHRILIDKGLQIQALDNPILRDTHEQIGLDLTRFAESNFTTANLCYVNRGVIFLGTAPGIPWGILADYGDPEYILDVEVPYVSNLISYQWRDEKDITQQSEILEAKTHFDLVRNSFPDVLCYTNQSGFQFSAAGLQTYMQGAQPDMMMFDAYPFNGNVTGGSPKILYEAMQKYRQLGLFGNDGTGTQPVPYGLWLQTYTGTDGNVTHAASDSEMRLNQFSAWAFGYQFAIAFEYTKAFANDHRIDSILFNGVGETSPTAAFYQIAETNRQSRNLGPALVRLLSTDVRMVMGRHDSGTVNDTPTGITAGIADTDTYLTGVSAANLGSKNNGLPGDVIVGFFKALTEAFDGSAYSNEKYFMVTNGLSDAAGTAAETRQQIRLTFNMGSSNITSLQRLSRNTGTIEIVPLVSDGNGIYHVDLVLDGGTGDLFKYNTGAPFVGVEEDLLLSLVVSPETQNVAKEAGSASFAVGNGGTGSMAWTAAVTSGGSWLSITSGASGTNSGSIVVAFTKNTVIETPRTATVQIASTGAAGSPRTVTVVQAAPALTPGDANKDGKVDVSDLGILAANYGATTGAAWDKGDFNNDGKVDVSDLGILAANYGTGTGVSLDFNQDAKALGLTTDNIEPAKAEPASISSLGCASAGLPLIAGLLLAGLMLVKLDE